MEIEILNINWFVSKTNRKTAYLKKATEEAHDEFLRNKKLNLDNNNYTLDVTGFIIADFLDDFQDVDFIPTNIKHYFPNLNALELRSCSLSKISRQDLSSLTTLTELHITSNFIEELADDLLIDLKHLEIVRFLRNKIKFVGKDVFKNLDKLKYVDLTGNPSINVLCAENGAYENTDHVKNFMRVYSLKDLNKIIEEIFHSHPPQIFVDIQKVLKIDDFKDFTIKIGENEFKVHKLMLAARSETLAEMIKNNPDADELFLADIEPDILQKILDYIYEDKVPGKYDEKLKEVFAAAGKLKIEKLNNEVGKNLLDFVNPDNSFDMLIIASRNGHEELKKKCFEELKKFLNAENLKDGMMDNIEALTKLVKAKLAYDKIKKEFEENL